MKRFAFLLIALIATVAAAQSFVRQGAGTPKTVPWVVQGPTGAGTGSGTAPVLTTSGYITAGAPAATVAVSGASASASGLTAGAFYRVACSVPCFFRTGAGNAVTTDAQFFGPAVEIIGLPTGSTAIAFIASAGVSGTCTLTLLRTGP